MSRLFRFFMRSKPGRLQGSVVELERLKQDEDEHCRPPVTFFDWDVFRKYNKDARMSTPSLKRPKVWGLTPPRYDISGVMPLLISTFEASLKAKSMANDPLVRTSHLVGCSGMTVQDGRASVRGAGNDKKHQETKKEWRRKIEKIGGAEEKPLVKDDGDSSGTDANIPEEMESAGLTATGEDGDTSGGE